MATNCQTGLGNNGGLCTQFACLHSPSKVMNYSQYLSVVSQIRWVYQRSAEQSFQQSGLFDGSNGIPLSINSIRYNTVQKHHLMMRCPTVALDSPLDSDFIQTSFIHVHILGNVYLYQFSVLPSNFILILSLSSCTFPLIPLLVLLPQLILQFLIPSPHVHNYLFYFLFFFN